MPLERRLTGVYSRRAASIRSAPATAVRVPWSMARGPNSQRGKSDGGSQRSAHQVGPDRGGPAAVSRLSGSQSGPRRGKYEEIRRKLMTFFRCNGFWKAEDHVDETIDRTIRRLGEVRDLMPFIRGVARHVASEVRRMAPREIPLEDIREIASRGQRDEEGERSFSKRLKWWYECADRLTAEDREMLLQYYQYDRSQKVENKRNLAALMGISTATLRVRAFRARKQLEKLVVESMKGFPANET